MSTTWKETKQQYLLMLIREGDLSNSELDGLIGEAQRMTSDRGNLSKIATIDDMRRVVDEHKAKRDCPTCRWDCEQGNDHPRWGEQWLRDELEKDGACPIWEQHNANPKYALIPDGILYDEVVRFITYGQDALNELKMRCKCCELGFENSDQVPPCKEVGGTCGNKNIIAKMEGK